jgi:glycosyltransferase involved in cell wall biosynthesis
MTNKTLAFVNSSKSWGGGEKWHFEAARDLYKCGYKIFFFCETGSEIEQRLQTEGIRTEALNIRNLSFLNPVKLIALSTIFRKLGIQTLLMNSPADVKLAAPAARIAGIPNIIFRRGMPHPISNNFYNRWLFHKVVHKVIANSQAVADSLDASLSGVVPHEKLTIVENGMEFPDLTTITPLDIGTDNRLLLATAGRMVKQKNQLFLLEVADTLRNQGLEFQLIIAGTGKLHDALAAGVTRLNLSAYIKLPGFIEDIPALLAMTDIFLFPSLYEGSPNTLIEAAGVGLPVVASDIPPSREILPDNSVGRLVELGDVDGFCHAINEFAHDRTLRDEVGTSAKNRVGKLFSLEAAREKLVNLL